MVAWAAIIAAIPTIVEKGKAVYEWADQQFGGGGDDKATKLAKFRSLMATSLKEAVAYAEKGAQEVDNAKSAFLFAQADARLTALEVLLKHPTASLLGSEKDREWVPQYNAVVTYVAALKAERAKGVEQAKLVTVSFEMGTDFWDKIAAMKGGNVTEEQQKKVLEEKPYLKTWLLTNRPEMAPAWLKDEWAAQGIKPSGGLTAAGASTASVAAQDITGGFKITTGTVVAVLGLILAWKYLAK